MIKHAFRQNAFALVTSLIFAALIMIITGTVVFKINDESRDIVKKEKNERAMIYSETILAHTIDKLNNDNFNQLGVPNSYEAAANLLISSDNWMPEYYDNGNISIYQVNLKNNLSNHPFIINLLNNPEHSKKFYDPNGLTGIISALDHEQLANAADMELTTFQNLSEENKVSTVLDSLYNNAYRSYRIYDNSTYLNAHTEVSLFPFTTNVINKTDTELHPIGLKPIPHSDLFKLKIKTFIPNRAKAEVSRTLEVIVSRPVNITRATQFSIIADKNINLGNANTSSGPDNVVTSTHQGDIHSNENIVIGSTGYIDGKITSAGTVNVPEGYIPSTTYDPANTSDPRYQTDSVYNKSGSMSGVREIPVPDLQLGTLPVNDCKSTTGYVANPQIFKDCVIDEINMSGNNIYNFEGIVYIKGNLSQTGNSIFLAKGEAPVRIVADGTIGISGTASAISEQSVIFVSNAPSGNAINVTGTAGTGNKNGALFYASSPQANINLTGTADFLGAILSKGTVTSNGNANIRRDDDLTAISQYIKPERADFLMNIVSWKELK